MAIEISLTVTPTQINLGEIVTVSWTTSGAFDNLLLADNLANQIDLGAGDTAGTMKFLPVTDGTFNVSVIGVGDIDRRDQTESTTKTVTVIVL
jgi:hypothetical protein